MEWTTFEKEMPPIGKTILIAGKFIRHDFSLSPREQVKLWCAIAEVYRPFDSDEKFNPNYYELHYKNNIGEEVIGKVEKNIFWCKITMPEGEIYNDPSNPL